MSDDFMTLATAGMRWHMRPEHRELLLGPSGLRLDDWLRAQRNITVLRVSYNELVAQPRPQAERVCRFLDGRPDVERMVRAVDPTLYRNRTEPAGPAGLRIDG